MGQDLSLGNYNLNKLLAVSLDCYFGTWSCRCMTGLVPWQFKYKQFLCWGFGLVAVRLDLCTINSNINKLFVFVGALHCYVGAWTCSCMPTPLPRQTAALEFRLVAVCMDVHLGNLDINTPLVGTWECYVGAWTCSLCFFKATFSLGLVLCLLFP